MIWQGSVDTVPENWSLCDGSNDTPDLRDRFIVGSQLSYELDETGGHVEHSHSLTSYGHDHAFLANTTIESGIGFDDPTQSSVLTGNTSIRGHLPTWYSLAYIQYKGSPDA